MVNIYDECPICLEPIDDIKDISTLKCNHKYHKVCLQMWLDIKPICPLCRMNVVDVFKCKDYKYNLFNSKIKLEINRIFIKSYFKKIYIDYKNIYKIGHIKEVIIIFFKLNDLDIIKKYRLPNESLCNTLFTSIKNKFIV
jgi:hypothetical protein